MVLVNPVLMVYVPYEVTPLGRRIKRDDLPRFATSEEVIGFLKNNPQHNTRLGKPVRLDWMGHTEDWALFEFHKGIGSTAHGGSIIHHDTRN